MRRRSFGFFVIALFFMGVLILRLYVLKDGQFAQVAEQQASLTVTVANVRGTIYDTNMKPLVNADTEYRASVTATPEALAAVSNRMTPEELAELTARLQSGKPVPIALEGLPSSTDGLVLLSAPVRYSEPLLAPHVLGYLDGDGLHGVSGAELYFDELLNNCSGKAEVTYTVDAVGRPLQGITPTLNDTLDQAKAGVVLTLDSEIQKIAENAAKKHMTKGAVVVMEPETGRIVAMVSLPDYQPSTVAQNLDGEDGALLNRALCNYNCGSVFKIVTAAAAIESGISLDTTYNCTGKVDVGGVTFHCHNRLGHGTLNMTQVSAQSCNQYLI